MFHTVGLDKSRGRGEKEREVDESIKILVYWLLVCPLLLVRENN